MSINPEWRRRVDHWRNAMPKLFYKSLGALELKGHVTAKQLSVVDAEKQAFKSMPTGTAWGAKWAYAWFQADFALPKSAAGERIVLRAEPGGESAIFVNGAAAGAKGWSDREITLTRKAKGGEKFHVLIESYAGHGPQVCGGGPVVHGELSVPEPGPTQSTVGTSSFGIWEEELYQLWLDMETLVQLRDNVLDKESLRVAEVDDGLKQLTLVVDLEIPRTEMLKTVRAGRALLRPLLEAHNGSTAPFMHAFGHSHIDVAWLWPLQETERKCCRTFASQLALMDEYPDYKFLQSQTHLYLMTKNKYPDVYARIMKAVKKGQWIPDGGMWVEADTNVSGGESLIRQFIHGKRFYRDELGVNSELMWLPDVFGYSGAMPQIMAGCGIKYFSTQKIFWTYNGGDPFPYNLFWWEGIDGTRVLSYLHNDYNSQTKPEAILARWHERVQKDSSHQGRLLPFGWGDGGGGPTRDHLEYLRRERDLEGLPRCKIAAPISYFEDMAAAAKKVQYPTWVGELYFQAHRGTYTTQAKTKKGNRQCEFALRETELWGAAAGVMAKSKYAYPLAQADLLWKDVLLCQFHDIIPGSSIQRVYEEAEAMHADVLGKARKLATAACSALLRADKTALTVFNSLSWTRQALVELPAGTTAVAAEDGTALPVQKLAGKIVTQVADIPACGWTTLRLGGATKPGKVKAAVTATRNTLENEFLKVTFDAAGEITSLFDKDSGREMADGACNSFRLYKDVPSWFDAWDVDSMYKQQPVALDRKAKVELIAAGPVVGVLRISRTINDSTLTQDVSLAAGSRRLDFSTTVHWQESHKLLKVNFPVSLRAEDALHEVQFGYVRRPTHGTRPYDASRFEVCNNKWTALVEEGRGAAVLNDCKYGVSVEGNSINLTLLRSPLAPDMTADKGVQTFTYAFTCWNGPLLTSGLMQTAYELNAPVTTASGKALGGGSLFSVSAANVIIETVKPAEDGSGDVVVRLYEAVRTATRCELRTSLPVKQVDATDMLENAGTKLTLKAGVVALDFRPFEIKTLRFKV